MKALNPYWNSLFDFRNLGNRLDQMKSSQPNRIARFPSPVWGLILFVPVGGCLLIAALSHYGTQPIEIILCLAVFGIFSTLGGIGYFFRARWARMLIVFLAMSAILVLSLERYAGIFAQLEDYTQNISALCKVHHVQMSTITLPGVCEERMGLPLSSVSRKFDSFAAYQAAYPQAERMEFPNAWDDSKDIAIGLCLDEKRKRITKARIWNCPLCNEAKKKWSQELEEKP